MKIFTIIISSAMLIAQTAKVQIIHNSPYPTVDIYVNDSTALAGVSYRACTGLIDLPTNTTVGIAPAGGDVIASFPFELVENGTYVVTASGIVGDTNYPFNLLASGMDTSAIDENSFALKVLHGVTDAPAVDIYANGSLLVDSLVYSEYTGYIQVASANYTIDVTPHGSREVVGTFSAPLTGLGGGTGVVYASGFLSPTETDSAFTLVLVTPSGYTVTLPATFTALKLDELRSSFPSKFMINQNYPNPFNPTTTISYELYKDAIVDVTIYNLAGRKVRTLVSANEPAGIKSVRWNGRNDSGSPVSAGTYLYIISAGEYTLTKKMVLLK